MDVFGAVYIIENAQQFWSELEEILHNIPPDCTLSRLDSTLRSFISLCSSYHEQYLQSPLQLEHSCDLLLASELFTFHSERMCELLLHDAQRTTDPHSQLILYNILLSFGRRNSTFLRSHKRWEPVLPLLMDHITLEIDPDVDDTFIGGSTSGSSSGAYRGLAVPIEVKLRSLSIRLLYEVCRVQKLSLHDLKLFNDGFIAHLFDLVEQTRNQQDESFNYSVIKLIVALNEQFMVASLHPETPQPDAKFPRDGNKSGSENRVLRVLMSRLGLSMTFGENLIFMLNRANRTNEDLVMQLLVLKLLYLLFNTKGTAEYFYTNDLCVLVDVFLREIVNLDEDNESLRHTYLRVLHPLLTKTQLRAMPYKRPQIVRVLESLIENEKVRDVDPTTKRLVERCLSGDCPGFDAVSITSAPQASSSRTLFEPNADTDKSAGKSKVLKSSRSVENLKLKPHRHRSGHHNQTLHHLGNSSSSSLPRVASAAVPPRNLGAPRSRRDRAGSVSGETPASTHERKASTLVDTASFTSEPELSPVDTPEIRVVPASSSPGNHAGPPRSPTPHHPHSSSPRRTAPAPPPKRRKPPAVPAQARGSKTLPGLTSSASQPVLSPLGQGARKALPH
ncbi:unnamed protein product [Somion occarium]|uniref:SPIN90/Ldb17 leucine-rich domain-containing protein n=1 Tax=Somion occarium TaxID=3059160 RepID=A0ABP1DQX4_9APHY